MRILGIAGSLRAGSYNRRLLSLAADSLPDGVELAVWEGLRDLPAFDEDEEQTTSLAVAGFRSAVAGADAVLIATPEYNGSIPGALKNALDWGSRPREAAVFRGKPVAVIGASTGSFGGVWAHAETRKILGLMGARVVEAELSVGKAQDRLAEPDAELLEQLRAAVDLLVTEAAARRAAA
jgi:chromate reductase